MSDWTYPILRKIWVILQTPDWEDGEPYLARGDIAEIGDLILELNEELWRTAEMQQAIEPPYWQCICGIKTVRLTDTTECKCKDIYLQNWEYVEAEPEVTK